MSIIVVTLIVFGLSGLTDCTTSYDQRQTGDLNVQIGLKNIQLIALLKGGNDEYVDYDYAYDYSEMTIKPQNGTTPKPLNVSITPSQVINSSIAPAANTMESSITNEETRINVTEFSDNRVGYRINRTDSLNNETESNINVTNNITEPNINNDTKLITNANETYNNVTKNPAVVDLMAANYSSYSTTITSADNISTTVSPTTLKEENAATTSANNNCRRGFVQNSQGKCEYKVHGTNALRRIIKLAQKIKIGRGLTET